jgi:hypothetical protein
MVDKNILKQTLNDRLKEIDEFVDNFLPNNPIKNIMNNNWYLYNDSNQVKMAYTKENLQNPNAYLLFYYRHD